MPNRKAKDRKRKRMLSNKRWATEGRTAKQHKNGWLSKKKRVYNYLYMVDDD